MNLPWRTETLPELAAILARRPGHETVRTHLAEILRHGLGVAAADLRQEDWRARQGADRHAVREYRLRVEVRPRP